MLNMKLKQRTLHTITVLYIQTFILMLQQYLVSGSRLNHFIDYYEPVYYNAQEFHNQHKIVERSIDSTLRLNFKAFGRSFKIRLKRDESVYHPEVAVEDSHGPLKFKTTSTYIGKLEGEKSLVYGIVTTSGHFEGTIKIPSATYMLERSVHHVTKPVDFHSVIYNTNHVTFNSTICNSNHKHKHYYGKEATESHTNHWIDGNHGHNIRKRAIDATKTTCELYMQADHLFYQHFYSNVETAIEQLTLHVMAVNQIFPSNDFDKDGSNDNIQFIIKRMKVYTDKNAAGYKFPLDSYGVESFLDIHSQENYDAFCLSYIFTYRDFEGGVLGLAWTADLANSGGVCEKYKTYQDGDKSLNTGLVTLLNYGNSVPSAVSHTTFAHEIGHNFGSSHDPDNDPQCSPGGTNGNYIMYARATSGSLPNNDEFSSCTVEEVGPILEQKARDSDGCFIPFPGSICGNKVVESGEDCDCGWDDQCDETCCNPQKTDPGSNTPCTLTVSSTCSPSVNFCCSPSTCNWYSAGDNHVCRANTTCKEASVCQNSGVCPDPVSKTNGTACAENQVCYLGECSSAICQANGLEACQCSPTIAGDWKDEKLCQACCIDSDGACKSTYSISGIPDSKSPPGNPCNDYQGYCDVFYVCREVDPSGPLSRLRNFIFSGQAIETVKEYLTKHWYIGLAAGVGLLIITILVVKFCSKSHGPKKTKGYSAHSNRISPTTSHM